MQIHSNVVSLTPTAAIARLKDFKRPATSVREWVAQDPGLKATQITGVRLNPTELRVDVILETAEGTLPAPTALTEDHKVVAETPKAVLSFPDGQPFQASNPAEGIAFVIVYQVNASTVRVVVTATEEAPTVQVRSSDRALTLSIKLSCI